MFQSFDGPHSNNMISKFEQSQVLFLGTPRDHIVSVLHPKPHSTCFGPDIRALDRRQGKPHKALVMAKEARGLREGLALHKTEE